VASALHFLQTGQVLAWACERVHFEDLVGVRVLLVRFLRLEDDIQAAGTFLNVLRYGHIDVLGEVHVKVNYRFGAVHRGVRSVFL
jgi:hypothetical protein